MPDPEVSTPDLDAVIDVRFRPIEAELYVTLDYLNILDQQLPVIARSERARLERELEGLDEVEFLTTLRWIDEYIDEDLPRLYFSPVLVQLWAVFESAITEISRYLKEQQGQLLSIEDLRGANDFERAEKYYRDVLRFPLIAVAGAREQLDMLLLARKYSRSFKRPYLRDQTKQTSETSRFTRPWVGCAYRFALHKFPDRFCETNGAHSRQCSGRLNEKSKRGIRN